MRKDKLTRQERAELEGIEMKPRTAKTDEVSPILGRLINRGLASSEKSGLPGRTTLDITENGLRALRGDYRRSL